MRRGAPYRSGEAGLLIDRVRHRLYQRELCGGLAILKVLGLAAGRKMVNLTPEKLLAK